MYDLFVLFCSFLKHSCAMNQYLKYTVGNNINKLSDSHKICGIWSATTKSSKSNAKYRWIMKVNRAQILKSEEKKHTNVSLDMVHKPELPRQIKTHE